MARNDRDVAQLVSGVPVGQGAREATPAVCLVVPGQVHRSIVAQGVDVLYKIGAAVVNAVKQARRATLHICVGGGCHEVFLDLPSADNAG